MTDIEQELKDITNALVAINQKLAVKEERELSLTSWRGTMSKLLIVEGMALLLIAAGMISFHGPAALELIPK